MADKLVFKGVAAAVAQVDDVTPANVEIGDVFTIRLTNRAGETYLISFTATATTVQNVVEGLSALAATASTNGWGPWNEVVTTEDDTKLIITASVAGEPFWVTTGATNGGAADTQTLTRSASTACGGPSIWSDTDNWYNATDATWGAIYADGEEVEIPADLAVPIHGETYTATKADALMVRNGMDQAIGSETYPLEISLQAQTNRLVTLNGVAEQHWKIHYAAECRVRQAATASAGEYGLNLTGTNCGELYVQPDTGEANSSVGVAAAAGESAEWDTIRVSGGIVAIGADVIDNGEAHLNYLYVTGGEVLCEATVDEIHADSGSGELIYRGGAATSVRAISGGGAVIRWDSDANITSAYCGGGSQIDLDAGHGAMTITNTYLYSGYKWTDTARRATYTNGLDLVGCSLADGDLDLGPHYTMTPSAI